MARDRGSTIPLILGFFLLALLTVSGAVALGQAFVQQRDLQDTCDGAATAAVASAADLDRGQGPAGGGSLRLADVQRAVAGYLARAPDRRGIAVRADLSADQDLLTLHCEQDSSLVLGALFGRGHVRHRVTSSARAAVVA